MATKRRRKLRKLPSPQPSSSPHIASGILPRPPRSRNTTPAHPLLANSLAIDLAAHGSPSSWRTRLLPLSWTSASTAPLYCVVLPQLCWLTYSDSQRHGLFQAWYAESPVRCAILDVDANITAPRLCWKRFPVLCLPDCNCDQGPRCWRRRIRLWSSWCRQQALVPHRRRWSRQQSLELQARYRRPRLLHRRRGNQRCVRSR